MIKNKIFVVSFLMILLPFMDFAFSASSVGCLAGGRYSFGGGGCCGDGIINGIGESCDAGFSLNTANDLEGCYSDCTLRPYVYKNFTNVENCNGQAGYTVGGYCIFDGTPLNTPYIASDQTHRCNGGNVEMIWNTSFLTGSAPELYNSVGSAFYPAACESPGCNNNILYSCSPGTAIDKYGNNRKCSLGGRNTACCSYASSCTTDCAGTCDTNSSNDATDYNGSAAGCGTLPPCGLSIPPGAAACNSTSPSSATDRSITTDCTSAPACKYKCADGYTPSGQSCVAQPLYTRYSCQSDSSWLSVTQSPSCPGGGATSYTAGTTYATTNTVCSLTTPYPADCPDPDNACDVPGVSCSIGTKTNDNNLSGPGDTRTWNCDSVLCEYTYPNLNNHGCGGSLGICQSP